MAQWVVNEAKKKVRFNSKTYRHKLMNFFSSSDSYRITKNAENENENENELASSSYSI